ncbi:GUN4 domain-containing protein [Nostoc sp. ChiQUE01b]|uniref:GUN4 domain-containing protein n=1 Tax=Nostoc sp. ChiQUE01b TaxID=3075376 RepID=UPI002AD22916|nr:GUN4 domain-containing protein [Nostoc sp. ChiQUE01b]MDZ8258603.1 GUN4 domain-containing protein [Nostoc sp. ChiQUE01b]
MVDSSTDNPNSRQESILNANVSDQAADLDSLGFEPYVSAIAEFLTNPVTQPPLTISIEGAWGSGKSSFMKQLQKAIEEGQQKKFENKLQNNLGKFEINARTYIRKFYRRLPYRLDDTLEFIFLQSLSILITTYKSLRLNLNKLKYKPKTVWFNAWRHEKAEALWAAFALEFLRQISLSRHRSDIFRNLIGNFRLFLFRFDWKNGIQLIFLALLGSLIIIVFAVVALQKGNELLQQGGEIKQIFQQQLTLPSVILKFIVYGFSATGFISLLLKLLNIGDPKNDLTKYLKSPNYENQTTFVEKFHEDFKKIVEAYAGKNNKVYVFIDDLDRCELPKSADLMQAINMMIANDPQLIFILGMDREKVAAGIAVKYKELIPYVALDVETPVRYGSSIKAMEYGYAFLEKFIQIPFQVPQPAQSDFQRFLDKIALPVQQKKKPSFWKSIRNNISTFLRQLNNQQQPSRNLEVQLSQVQPQQTQTPQQNKLERRERIKFNVTQDSPTVRDIVLMVASALDYNPRRLKQFINLFRLKTYIASNTGLFDEIVDESQGASINQLLTLEQLGKFTAINVKWPRLLVDLDVDRKLLTNLQKIALNHTANFDFSKCNEITKYWGGKPKLLELLCYSEISSSYQSGTIDIEEKYSLEKVDVDKLLQVSPGTQDDLSSERSVDYTKLRDFLAARNWREADYETYLVMLQAVGKDEDYWLYPNELLNFPCTDLHTIDRLWVKYSNGRFGFSVQKNIYLEVGGKTDGKYDEEAYNKFAIRVGWRVEGNWISSNDVNFDIFAQEGHLPILHISTNTFPPTPRIESLTTFSTMKAISSLASRLVNCNI